MIPLVIVGGAFALLASYEPTPLPTQTAVVESPFAQATGEGIDLALDQLKRLTTRAQGNATSQAPVTAGPRARTETIDCYFGVAPVQWANSACVQEESWALVLGCSADQTLEVPTGRREFDESTQRWGQWQQVGQMRCADAPGSVARVDEVAEAVERAFASLPIEPSALVVQPGQGWNFVNVPMIVYTDDHTQVLRTTLLGSDIEVEVMPRSFTWNFGDEHALPYETTDPGAPYPNHTLNHTYTQIGEVTITLTTAWSGRFRLVGADSWAPISGTAVTTSSTPPIEIIEARARLVDQPLLN